VKDKEIEMMANKIPMYALAGMAINTLTAMIPRNITIFFFRMEATIKAKLMQYPIPVYIMNIGSTPPN